MRRLAEDALRFLAGLLLVASGLAALGLVGWALDALLRAVPALVVGLMLASLASLAGAAVALVAAAVALMPARRADPDPDREEA